MGRDIQAAYKAALLDEYEAYMRAGRTEDADAVAAVLRDEHDHKVESDIKERADAKAPEAAVPAKPKRRS